MNKKGLIVIIASASVAVLLFLLTLILGNNDSNETQTKQSEHGLLGQESTLENNKDDQKMIEEEEAGEKIDEQADSEPAQPDPIATKKIPEQVTTRELETMIFTEDDQLERSYLSQEIQNELDDSSLTGKKDETESIKRFAVSWSPENDPTPYLPEYGSEAEKLMIDRPEAAIFEQVKKLGEIFGLNGTTMRMNRENYSIMDTETGTFLLSFNIFQNTFQSAQLQIPLENKDAETGVTDFLFRNGLLDFDYTTQKFVDEARGSTWISFIPEHDLPFIVFKDRPSAPEGTAFKTADGKQMVYIGMQGDIDVEVDSQNVIRQIYYLAPNVTNVGSLPLRAQEEVISLLEAGVFGSGEALLAHPGAVDIKGRNEFFDLIAQPDVTVSDGEIYSISCGYMMEPEQNLQVFLPPVCIAHATGNIGGYQALFRVVVPIADSDL